MSENNVIKIHGKDYLTVAGRLAIAHEGSKTLSITTEVLPDTNGNVVIKATVVTDKGTFTGISGANTSKAIEKQSPYEVAETSAVGRALGFAGYGVTDGIATADEMVKAGAISDDHCSEPDCQNKQFPIPSKVVEFSMAKYKRVICYRCQQKYETPTM